MFKNAILIAGLWSCHIAFLCGAELNVPKGFRAIFNGKDLSGWYGWNPHLSQKLEGEKLENNLKEQKEDFRNHWHVENGELVNAGTGPYAATEENFGDIELLIEYKTVPGADSGIYLRGNPQVQIWDTNQKFDPAKPHRRPHLGSGGLFNNEPQTLGRDPIEKVDRPFGQWNSFNIKIIGDRTWVSLNGRPLVFGASFANFFKKGEPLPEKGPIMLQTHGGEIRWRNIFVREIGKSEAEKFLNDNPPLPEPTLYDVSYGSHPKQLIHFWKAKSDKPTPLLFYVHGGGWVNGGRLSGVAPILSELLANGISVASVEYRNIEESTKDGEVPPVNGPLTDAARALQFVRSKAEEWGIDKKQIAASGGSAGACTSLWLAFHDDMADPNSSDPVARESTRLAFAAVSGAQTTLDPAQMREWTPNSTYGGHAFGIKADPEKNLKAFDVFIAKRSEILPWIKQYSPYELVSSDDPPVYMSYSTPPAIGKPEKDPTHTANFGVKLQEHVKSKGGEAELYYPGVNDSIPNSTLKAILKFFKKG